MGIYAIDGWRSVLVRSALTGPVVAARACTVLCGGEKSATRHKSLHYNSHKGLSSITARAQGPPFRLLAILMSSMQCDKATDSGCVSGPAVSAPTRGRPRHAIMLERRSAGIVLFDLVYSLDHYDLR
ncbi:hypothetical protein DPEC_G00112260 [Dallia pectoralis]|uniref:Uncharacterized protein n=1 Tax=Dallia pectoralis TaxID=75939 RepID=A0ACC2GTF9_DALPE|nr:hypothetical protein DPEC_G00112260 [Dallia pectoralis]